MRRVVHGSTTPLEFEQATSAAAAADINVSPGFISHAAPAPTADVTRFGYLFHDLVENDPNALLPESPATIANLARLGETMREKEKGLNSKIPSAYTYFGQFIDHDIVFSDVPRTPKDLTDSCMLDALLVPWPMNYILEKVKNRRTRILELDVIYGEGALHDNRLMKLGKVSQSKTGHVPKTKDVYHDLPRGPMSATAERDRVAYIGDKRNDQTVIISQLHVAFLRAHNAIVKRQNCSFEEAQKLLRQHYHWIIIHDFLEKRIADEATVKAVLSSDKPLYEPPADKFFLPLEFTVAAFRFGHSMVRNLYYLNDLYPSVSLKYLFTLTALSENIRPTPGAGKPTLPEDMIIQWEKFVGRENVARLIDTRLVEPLRMILDEAERPVPCETRLAVQDLKRGYMMRIPTGQAIARALGLHIMTAQEIEEAVKDNQEQLDVLRHSGFLERTPLWFYILAEAARTGCGNRLGLVGSRLVAEVLIGLIRRSKDSILSKSASPWTPTLPSTVKGEFDLPDLLRLAGVLN